MSVNRGKAFEQVIRESFEKVPNVSIDRLHDQTNGYLGGANIADFIVYKEPYEYYFECKSVHGNTLPFSNITSTQWNGLLEKSKIQGVIAGVICWWCDRDITRFIPINTLKVMRECGYKSYKYDIDVYQGESSHIVNGTKKRVFFDYDMEKFLKELEYEYSRRNKTES